MGDSIKEGYQLSFTYHKQGVKLMSKAKALMMTYEFIEREACGEAFVVDFNWIAQVWTVRA